MASDQSHDYMPYQVRRGDVVQSDSVQFGEETDLIEMPISWSNDDFPHFEYVRGSGLQNADNVMANWVGDFRFMVEDTNWGIMTYTFHPFVIGRGHRMLMLDEFIKRLSDLGADFVTAEAAVLEFKQAAG